MTYVVGGQRFGLRAAFTLSFVALLTACQSSSNQTAGNTVPETQNALANASVDQTLNPATSEQALAEPATAQTDVASLQVATSPSSAQCAIPIAGGPPPIPPRGADFGEAVGKNMGKSVKRGVIQQIGGAVAGGLGAAIAGGVAQSTIRNEEDIKGIWMITDGRPDCACEISIDSLRKLQGKGADTGQSLTRGCTDPKMLQVAAWQLGYAFAGYGASFELKRSDGKSVLASMTRSGIHHFNGTFADGTPVTMWRDSQNYNQMAAFKKSVK